MSNYYKPHSWNTICDVCGFKFKSEQLRKRWDGLMVCSADYELRNPQDLIRTPKDNPAVPWSRPEPADTFVSTSRPITTEVSLADFLLTESGVIINTEG